MCVYVIGPANGPYKIGFTNNLKKRLEAIQGASPVDVAVHHHIEVPDPTAARKLEARAHRHLADERLRGEWFNCTLEQAAEALDYAVEATRQVPNFELDHGLRQVSDFAAWMEHEGLTLRGASEALGCSVSAALVWKRRRPPRYILMACYHVTMKLPELEDWLADKSVLSEWAASQPLIQ